ncbi:MAG: enoyl-CoA hydratase-related protein [Bacteroidales bacterium]|jgi:enoyl-CoA hydratase
MNYEILKHEIREGIAIVTINRPQAMNALNSRFFAEMNELLNEFENRKDIRVMILTGEGKAFAAGADIAEMVDMNSEQGKKFSKVGQDVYNKMGTVSFPIIGAINGFSLGGGCELGMGCDIRIASTLAKFGQPEVNLGLIPGYAGTQRLPRYIGLNNALYLLLTADMITAEEALRLGLVQKVVEPEKLMEEAMAMAKKIASKGPKAVKKIKRVTRDGMLTDFRSGSELESEEFGSLFGNEGAEGMRAFLEKRKPNW